jgi:hypothetical protein
MKKILLTIIASTGLALLMPLAASALGNPTQTIVTGNVTHNGSPVSGASVTVTCDGNILVDPLTDSDGSYQVTFIPSSLCPDESTATAVSTGPGGLHGSNSAPVTAVTTKINISTVNVSVVPELGMITAGSAAILGGGAFMIVRRRQLGAK